MKGQRPIVKIIAVTTYACPSRLDENVDQPLNELGRSGSNQDVDGARFSCAGAREHTMSILSILWDELREIAWLASIVGGFSVLGVGLAVTLALAL